MSDPGSDDSGRSLNWVAFYVSGVTGPAVSSSLSVVSLLTLVGFHRVFFEVFTQIYHFPTKPDM